jgi:acetyltransferase-like isoleucine patch superfamily enzyme
MPRRLITVLRQEWNGAHLGLAVAVRLSGALPELTANRVRTSAFRAAGVQIGRGSVIGGRLTIAGGPGARHRVTIGTKNWINASCFFDASDTIEICNEVEIAQDVMILTQTHEIGPPNRRAGRNLTAPVRIETGSGSVLER